MTTSSNDVDRSNQTGLADRTRERQAEDGFQAAVSLGNVQQLSALAQDKPELRQAIDTALLGNKDWSGFHEFAQSQQPTPQTVLAANATTPASTIQLAAATPVHANATLPSITQRDVTSFQRSNTAALDTAQKQLAQIDGLNNRMAFARVSDLTPKSQVSYDKLVASLNTEKAGLTREVALRTQAADAIAQSTQPASSLAQDPAVASALGSLKQHLATNVTKPDELKAIEQGIGKLSAYDVPSWTRYGQVGGPSYTLRPASDPTNKLANSPAWNTLQANGQVTASEQRVISRMADNESFGNLDALQAYDSEIASLGAMQKTLNPLGQGELARQVWHFSQEKPADYQRLFADRGWSVQHTGRGDTAGDYTMGFRNSADPNAPSLTGTTLRNYVHDRAHPENWTQTLDPLLRAGQDPAFQQQQITDYMERLNTSVDVKPSGYTDRIASYVTSEQAAALVLDQHVNRPGYVASDFGRALDGFYAANPKAPRDPSTWTAQQRATYEPTIVSNYQQQRAAQDGRVMTDPVERYNHIVGGGVLSAAPGSFERTRP